jgi:hypothetical protein
MLGGGKRKGRLVDQPGGTMSKSQPPVIACNLDVFSPAERDRRAALAQAIVAQAHSVRELTDGYALQLPVTSSLAQESLEWLLLERRCCSFFRLELEIEPEEGSLWLRLRGGPGVKEFLSSAGTISRRAGGTACC